MDFVKARKDVDYFRYSLNAKSEQAFRGKRSPGVRRASDPANLPLGNLTKKMCIRASSKAWKVVFANS